MDNVILSRTFTQRGYSRDEVARMLARGELVHLRRGAYARATGQILDERDEHRRLIIATLPQVSPRSVVSHASAAALHQLPVWKSALDRVHLTRDRLNGGRRDRIVHLHSTPISPDEIIELDGLRVTSLSRTVIDVARSLPYEQSVCIGDAALAAGLGTIELESALKHASYRPGVASARRVSAFLDGRSESPGESLSRISLAQAGIAPSELQYAVRTSTSVLVGRSDFCWPEHRTLGEFDGKVKYGRLLKPGQEPGDVVFDEKIREDALRDLGWQVVRWTWADLSRPHIIVDRLQRAFARSGG